MKTQAISMQMASTQAYNTRKSNTNGFKGGTTYVIVPASLKEDTFGTWAAKNVITASLFSVAWDMGTNVVSKFSKNVEAISAKQMCKNVPKVAGVFLLIGGIFKLVSNAIDKN